VTGPDRNIVPVGEGGVGPFFRAEQSEAALHRGLHGPDPIEGTVGVDTRNDVESPSVILYELELTRGPKLMVDPVREAVEIERVEVVGFDE
jgi:hypothetical protein